MEHYEHHGISTMQTTSTSTSDTSTRPSSIPLPTMSEEMHARLAADIAKRGCIVPIVVDADGKVIDGRARAEICRGLNLTPKKIVLANLSPEERADWRLALNLCRRQLSREQVREIVAWQLARAPGASDRSVAADLGVSHHTVGAVRRDRGLVADHRTGRDGRTRATIVHTVSEGKAKQVAKHLLALGSSAPPGAQTTKNVEMAAQELERSKFLATMPKDPRTHQDFVVNHGDFRSAVIEPNSVDLVICDPPFSMHRKLGRPLGEKIFSCLKPGGLAAVYTGPDNQINWIDQIRMSGLVWFWNVVLHHPNSKRLVKGAIHNLYTPVTMFQKPPGCVVLNVPLPDVLNDPTYEKSYHKWQQPVGPVIELVRSLTRPGALVVDFTTGSGTTGVATWRAGEGRRFVGWELDGETVRVARARIAEEWRRPVSP